MDLLSTLPSPLREGLDACVALARRSASPLAMYNLGTVHLRAGDLATAEVWFREALRLDPGFAEANQNLAALLQDDGRAAEAQRYRDRAFRHTPLRVEHAPQPELRVLVLCGAGYGNVPIETLLPRQTTTRLKFFVEYASAADWAALPPFDLVFNAIGDADFLPPGAWQEHLSRLGTKVLNLPAHVARTRRDLLPTLLAGLPDVVVPRVVRQSECSHASDLIYPVLFRPIGAHGGDGVTLLPAADSVPPGEAYLTEYHAYRSADGYFRKYRVIYIAGAPFAYHLAISPHWLVHYFSADMQEAAWKRAEEAQFLQNSVAVLGTRGMAAINAIGQRLAMDYVGIDFSLLPDGRVLVFEANATMALHLDDCPLTFDYKHQAVPRILAAFGERLVS